MANELILQQENEGILEVSAPTSHIPCRSTLVPTPVGVRAPAADPLIEGRSNGRRATVCPMLLQEPHPLFIVSRAVSLAPPTALWAEPFALSALPSACVLVSPVAEPT